MVVHTDLNVAAIRCEIKKHNIKYTEKISANPNEFAFTLFDNNEEDLITADISKSYEIYVYNMRVQSLEQRCVVDCNK